MAEAKQKPAAGGGMLIIFGSLPGAGKTAIAQELACQLGAVHLRIDTIEQAIRDTGAFSQPLDDAGYRIGYAVGSPKEDVNRARCVVGLVVTSLQDQLPIHACCGLIPETDQ